MATEKVKLETLKTGDHFYHGGVRFKLLHKREQLNTCLINPDYNEQPAGVFISDECLVTPIKKD